MKFSSLYLPQSPCSSLSLKPVARTYLGDDRWRQPWSVRGTGCCNWGGRGLLWTPGKTQQYPLSPQPPWTQQRQELPSPQAVAPTVTHCRVIAAWCCKPVSVSDCVERHIPCKAHSIHICTSQSYMHSYSTYAHSCNTALIYEHSIYIPSWRMVLPRRWHLRRMVLPERWYYLYGWTLLGYDTSWNDGTSGG